MWTDNDGVTHLEPQDLEKRYCLVSDGRGGFSLGLADDCSVSTMPTNNPAAPSPIPEIRPKKANSQKGCWQEKRGNRKHH